MLCVISDSRCEVSQLQLWHSTLIYCYSFFQANLVDCFLDDIRNHFEISSRVTEFFLNHSVFKIWCVLWTILSLRAWRNLRHRLWRHPLVSMNYYLVFFVFSGLGFFVFKHFFSMTGPFARCHLWQPLWSVSITALT